MVTRAKFVCTDKKVANSGSNITLQAVTKGNPENDEFFKFTPAGQLTLYAVNPKVEGMFEVDSEYYLDITPAK